MDFQNQLPDTSRNKLRIGSLFSGAGALDTALEKLFGAQTVWVSENDEHASTALAARYPGIPNLGNVTAINWADVTPVDIMAGGFPCQDLSMAGRRSGLAAGTRSGLWYTYAQGIDALKPRIVVIENVRGILTAESDRGRTAAQVVLDDLEGLGYTTHWKTQRAADAGAPHRRERVFFLAVRNDATIPAPIVDVHPYDRPKGQRLLPTPEAKNSHAGPDYARMNRPRSGGHDLVTAVAYHKVAQGNWGMFTDAIEAWTDIRGIQPPSPVEPNTKGNPRIHAPFVEWMMGWTPGLVTSPSLEIPRSEQLKICGNGVVPQQAMLAVAELVRQAQTVHHEEPDTIPMF